VRSAYASAVDRERYGSRGTSSRYPEPARQSQSQSQSQPPRRRDDRPVRQPLPQQRRGVVSPRPSGRDSSEPWSEVPPELEELLRAQLSNKLSRPAHSETAPAAETATSEAVQAPVEKAKPASRSRRKPAEAIGGAAESAAPSEAVEAPVEKAKPASRSRRKPVEAAGDASGDVSGVEAAPAAPKKRAPARKRSAAAAEAAGDAISEGGESSGE
jgi:hypothetical protein